MRECQQCKKCFTDDVKNCPHDGLPTMHTISGEPVLEGKYHLESRIGQGGMGVVYKARHAYLKTQHAIKIILPDLVGNDPQLVTRFRQEALAAAAIRHQNVVQVTDYGVAQGTMPFLVMEFVQGEDLHDFLSREKRVHPEKAFELISAICKGIGAAHNQGIVHRDMKPLNIMILDGKSDMNEAVKILDFGLAKIKSGELLGSFIQAQTTGLMGSPYYMAPEQWSDEELDARSDIYSIGVMLYQMLVGDVPFKGSSIPAIMKKHLTDPPPPFAEKGVTDINPAIERVVFHTLEKERENRTASVDQLISEFETALKGNVTNVDQFEVTEASLPVSTLRVLSSPPKSKVFLNNVSIGETKDDGWLMLDGIQSGNHHLKVSHDGFEDWESSLFLDGKPKQIVAELQQSMGGTQREIPKPEQTMPFVASEQFTHKQSIHGINTQQGQAIPQNTVNQQVETGNQSVIAQPSPNNSIFSPIVLAIIGISGLLLLTVIGGVGLYMSGLFGGTEPNPTPSPTPTVANNNEDPPKIVKNEMVEIPGGTFTMGRNDGDVFSKPEHKVEVGTFLMDKTEVTNAEYANFVNETNYRAPLNWINNKPVPNTEMQPVRFVNIEDIDAFTKWRSKRDNVNYRLPTEAEWEYAARNGSENNLYPWGDVWDKDKAVLIRDLIFKDVGTKPEGKNKWGVLDLVGNVWELTSTKATAYPKAAPEVKDFIAKQKDSYVVRGLLPPKSTEDSAANSTVRSFTSAKNRDKAVGFRLVRDKN